MSEEEWFSASLLLAIINEHGGLWRRATSVVLIRAVDFDDAFVKACEAGHAMDEVYLNHEGEKVRWALERVATLDMLPETLTSGTEVYAMPHALEDDEAIDIDTEFTPERFPPDHTGISPT